MPILPISKEVYIREARQAVLSMYGQEYPEILSCQFHSTNERSIVLMDYSGGIEGNLLYTISTVASDLGDKGFYLSYPVSTKDEELTEHRPHPYWYVSFNDVLDYSRETETFTYRYIHFSPRGTWGIVASDDVFGVLSGTKKFIQRVLRMAPEVGDGVRNFISYWVEHKKRHNLNIDWVPLFLKNVYGKSEASKFTSIFFNVKDEPN